jgi:phosphocarrier protein
VDTPWLSHEPGSPVVRTVTVAFAVGLHARPAALFVQAVQQSGLAVRLSRRDGRSADARSILAVVTLDVRQGDEVVLQAEGTARNTRWIDWWNCFRMGELRE